MLHTAFFEERIADVYSKIVFKTKNYFHTALQDDLAKSDQMPQFNGIKEFRVTEIMGYEGRTGFIDVVLFDSNNSPVIAIEIDCGLKHKSMMKLISLQCQYKYYIYYGAASEEKIRDFVTTTDSSQAVTFIHKPLKLGKNKDYGITRDFYT